MKKILMVEDDKVVASIYRNKLCNAGFEVEVVADGESALGILKSKTFDLALLDLGLPKINGVEILKSIRSNPLTATLPVIVLSNSYIPALVQAAWKAGANKCLAKADCNPRHLVDVLQSMLAPPQAPPLATDTPTAPALSSDAIFQFQVRLALSSNAPGFIEDLRKRLKRLAQEEGPTHSLPELFDFYRAVYSLTGHAASAGFTSIANLCAALEALLKELHDKPAKVGPSPLRTIAQAIDVLAALFLKTRQSQVEQHRNPLILVLDDDIIARRTLSLALDKANLRSICVGEPGIAYGLIEENQFDLIFSDVEMPGMNGFDLCGKLRALPKHKNTPLVFVTSLADFGNRSRSTLSGGTDLIGKPFLLVELVVKALTYILRKPNEAAEFYGA